MAVITYTPTGEITTSSLLRITGAFLAIFSLLMGTLILFVIPLGCTFLGSLQLLILGFLFVFGVIVFIIGSILSRKENA